MTGFGLFSVWAVLFVPSTANRVQVDAHVGNIKSDIFDSCDDLQNIFHSRVKRLHALQQAHADPSSMTTITELRFAMRGAGVIRVLRRARDCPWVIEGNADEIGQVRDAAQLALGGNPCGVAAMEALTAHPPPEHQLKPLQDAVQILSSDNCEVQESISQTEISGLEDETLLSQMLIDEEERAQDQIDELMDEAAAENEGEAGAFIQTEGIFHRVMRMMGIVLLTLLYLLSCATVGVVIGGLILTLTLGLACDLVAQGPGALTCWIKGLGPALGGAAGLVSCGIDALYAQGNFSQLGRGNF